MADPKEQPGSGFLKSRLTEHGIKATIQRIVIYQALLNTDEHPTAEKIYDRIKTEHPSISLGTVYKTLDTLVEAGLAHKVKTVDDVQRFDARVESHSHLYCTKSNKIVDFDDSELRGLLENYFRKKNISDFKISDIQLQINGEFVNPNSKQN
jgi:Fur family peroxide stress response transcriptional regulator